jgi:hypothetical protein
MSASTVAMAAMLFQKFAVVRLMYFTYKIMRWHTLPQSPAKICGGVAYLGKVGCTQRESWVYAQGGRCLAEPAVLLYMKAGLLAHSALYVAES